MNNPEKINILKPEDIKSLSNLASTYDLGTKTIIGEDTDEIISELADLMSESIED